MQTEESQQSQHPATLAPRTLTLRKETLRRLTPAHLRLAAGGARPGTGNCVTHGETGCGATD